MTPAPGRVLLYGFGEEAPVLASRIHAIGYETVAASEPRAAAGLMTCAEPHVATALLPASFALPERGHELDHLIRAAGPFGLRFLATGTRPDEAACAELRGRGVRNCLWSPFQERELRFVLNRAAFDPSPGSCEPGRGDARTLMRVPTELSALVHTSGRVKPALIYCLSAAGCFLETRRPCLVGGSLEVALESTLPCLEVPG